jgi:CheY-like chemotaxis protein
VETSLPLIEAAHHQLEVDIAGEPMFVHGDPVRLSQVVANLLNNAAKFTPNGGRIWLTAARDGNTARVVVRDNGIGIPKSAQSSIFDLFTQLDRQYGRVHGGLGIGLTLVRQLVEMHGGTIEVTSEGSGKGSEFVVRLPLTARPTLERETQGNARSITAGRRILVIDDNEDAAESLTTLLDLLGADVQVAFDGDAALQLLRRHRPSVVLVDIGMPSMDGLEFARRARRLPEGRRATLVALTGWGRDENRKHSREAGLDYHLVKPLNLDALTQLLATLPPESVIEPDA